MNLKSFVNLFSVLLLLGSLSAHMRTCKTNILRSFGLHSRITPNRLNSVCPHASLNCCTEHDQMKLHKLWANHGFTHISSTHALNTSSFTKMRSVVAFKDKIDFKKIMELFKQKAVPKPSEHYLNHMQRVMIEIGKRNEAFLKNLMTNIPKRLQTMQNEMRHLRKAFLCSMCDWHNHRYYNAESMTLTYSAQFCTSIIQKFIDLLADKYMDVVRFLLNLDEFYYLITHDRLMKSALDRAVFRRYFLIIDKCKKNPSKMSECADICKEFSLNTFSYMFDGESAPWEAYNDAFNSAKNALVGEEREILQLFKLRRQNWSVKRLSTFAKNHSVISKTITDDPRTRRRKRNSFNLEFKSQAVKTFVERHHPLSSIQVETLDDELSSITLYKLADDPVDLTKFMILLDTKGGINLFKDARKMNFDSTAEQLIALIHSKGGDPNRLDEIIDDSVKAMLKEIQITDIAGFVSDYKLDFDEVAKKKTSGKDNENSAMLTLTSALLGLIAYMLV